MWWWQKPLQPQKEAQNGNARSKLCETFRTHNFTIVQDLLNSLILSECIYKAHDLGPQKAVEAVNEINRTFPPGIISIQAVQCSLPHTHHRYLVASSPDTIYVSFIGTKLAKDVLVDANFFHKPLWKTEKAEQSLPAVHRGFLDRARKVPVEKLLAIAEDQKKKLLLCGHSLGGAIASLSTLRILQQAADAQQAKPPVSCVTFGTPAIGNAALSGKVHKQGWTDCFHHIVLPEDLIPRLLSLREPVQQLDNQKVEVAVNMPVQNSGPTGRWTPGIWRRQAPNLAAATNPSEELDATTGQATPLQPDQPGAAGSYQFMLSGVRSTLQNASRWGSFVSEAPQRLWHKRKLVQEGGVEGDSVEAKEEEDGAVDLLMQGASADLLSHAEDESSDQAKRTWMQQLWNLQRAAVSAASAVGSVGQLLPNRIHFGNASSWAKPIGADGERSDVMENTRSWILAHHRMPAYRARALAMCNLVLQPGEAPDGNAHSWEVELSQNLVGQPTLQSAVGYTQPHAPSAPADGASGRWTWLPYIGGSNGSQRQHPMDIRVEGSDLDWLKQGRLLAFQSNWCPARLRLLPRHQGERARGQQAVQESKATPLQAPSWLPDWLQTRLSAPAEAQILQASLQLPQAIAMQVCNLERRQDIKDLELHLRSDFTAVSVPVQLKLPTVYLLGSSTQAAQKLASALSLQHSQDAGSPAVGQKRSEFMLDGSRWCNLLAAQAVTPKMAAATLTSALAAEAAPPGWLGGVSQAVRVHPPSSAGFQTWLAGPGAGEFDSRGGFRTILLVLDGQADLPKRIVTRLLHQAKLRETTLIVVHLDEPHKSSNSVKDFLLQQQSVTNVNFATTNLAGENLMDLRRTVYKALMEQGLQRPLAKL